VMSVLRDHNWKPSTAEPESCHRVKYASTDPMQSFGTFVTSKELFQFWIGLMD
jgi:hypothetical protein